jgi:membrane-bound ClpP family serine protease
MSNLHRSITVFGVYLLLAGLSFILIPNLILPIFGFATTTEIWIRITGLLTLILGIYFLYSVRHEDRHFFRVTLYGRLIFFTGVTLFVLFKLVSPMLIAFGLVDLIGAAWTWSALRATK